MPPRGKQPTTADLSTTERILQAFRMPRELVNFLKAEAQASGRDLTGYVNRTLDGVRTWFGLPAAAAAHLDADRKALGMHRYEYILHVLYQRSQQVIAEGPGFDGPGVERKKRR